MRWSTWVLLFCVNVVATYFCLRRGAAGCVVPDHREIKIGTLNGLLKQAGVDTDELLLALDK